MVLKGTKMNTPPRVTHSLVDQGLGPRMQTLEKPVQRSTRMENGEEGKTNAAAYVQKILCLGRLWGISGGPPLKVLEGPTKIGTRTLTVPGAKQKAKRNHVAQTSTGYVA